jgi:hypothetical protein
MTYQPQPISAGIPKGDDPAVIIRSSPQHVDRVGFAKAISNGVDPEWGTIVGGIGTGMDVDQTGGNLVITSGTTARAETIIRSTAAYEDGIRLRARLTLSQRIANNNFFVEMVDVIGDGLAYTISSATALVVTMPSGHGFDSSSVGQSMYIGLFAGTGTFLSGRYPIASVSGDNVTFTVSGFAVGSGTCSAFGWNYYQLQYQGTTATQVAFDTQRKGYASGATTATINTTAAPGHIAVITANDLVCTFADQLVATGATIKQTVRATRDENVPDDMQLRLQIRIANGSTNPASTTTLTVGFLGVANYSNQSVSINDVRPMGVGSALPVEIMRNVSQAVTGSLTSAGTTTNTPANGTTYNLVTTASNNLAFMKGSAGNLYEITVSNPTATPAYIKLYNKATAPVVASDVPVMTIAIPATAAGVGEKSFNFGSIGKRFATGIAIAVVGAAVATDATNTVAGIQVNATYI